MRGLEVQWMKKKYPRFRGQIQQGSTHKEFVTLQSNTYLFKHLTKKKSQNPVR